MSKRTTTLPHVISSLECQKRAAQCRNEATRSVSLNINLQLSRLADGWEALGIEIELCGSWEGRRLSRRHLSSWKPALRRELAQTLRLLD
jgi:hypothetical protein